MAHQDLSRWVRQNNLEEARKLLAASSNPRAIANTADEDGYTPLFYAVKQSPVHPEMVKLLAEAGADPNFERVIPLTGAIPFVSEEQIASSPQLQGMLEKLKDAGVDLLRLMFPQPGTPDGSASGSAMPPVSEHRERILVEALHQENVEVVRLLVEAGADIWSVDKNGYSALTNAAYGPTQLPIVRYLISKGVPLDAVSNYGESAIRVASTRLLLPQLESC